MAKPYLDDGCNWCGSQEWDDDLTDVEHAKDCPVPILRAIVDQWSSDYHCCRKSKRQENGHTEGCPLARATEVVGRRS